MKLTDLFNNVEVLAVHGKELLEPENIVKGIQN